MAVSPLLQQTLARYGLSSLLSWASEAIILGLGNDEILLQLYERPEFNARFPAIKAREAAGFPPVNPEEYLQFEAMMSALSTTWGMNITKEQTDKMLSLGVSAREGEERVNLAAAAVFDEPAETRSELSRMYGISTGQLIEYYMDPKTTQGVLQQQFRTAQIGGAALRSGYGEITTQQAQRLMQAGLDRTSAMTGFGELVANEELFRSYIGTEEEITRDDQIEVLAGNAELTGQLEQRANRRLAEYQGGGQFASGETGFALGSAKS